MPKSIFATLALVSLFLPFFIHAHGSGQTFQTTVGGYNIDIDYDAEGGFLVDQPVEFSFQLFNEARTQKIDFDDVWIEILVPKAEKESSTIFSSDIVNTKFPGAAMTFTFPNSGDYELQVQFNEAGKTVAAGTFPLSVKAINSQNRPTQRPATSILFEITALAVGFFVGAAVMVLLRQKKSI